MDNVINFEDKKKEQKDIVEAEEKPMDLRFVAVLLQLCDAYFNSEEGKKVPMIYVLQHFMCALTNVIINHTDDHKMQLDILESLYASARGNVERWHRNEAGE